MLVQTVRDQFKANMGEVDDEKVRLCLSVLNLLHSDAAHDRARVHNLPWCTASVMLCVLHMPLLHAFTAAAGSLSLWQWAQTHMHLCVHLHKQHGWVSHVSYLQHVYYLHTISPPSCRSKSRRKREWLCGAAQHLHMCILPLAAIATTSASDQASTLRQSTTSAAITGTTHGSTAHPMTFVLSQCRVLQGRAVKRDAHCIDARFHAHLRRAIRALHNLHLMEAERYVQVWDHTAQCAM